MDILNTQEYTKNAGDTLSHSTWNGVVEKVNEVVGAINEGGASGEGGSVSWGSINEKGNLELTSAKHINLEPAYDDTGADNGIYGDIQLKPGDDITLESSHRADSKKDEITIKTTTGISPKKPVKLQVIASDITLSSKGKIVEAGSNDSSNVMNVNVTTGNGKGYLKVRAQAIDLRCEDHGGIALQPKGEDSDGNMNKIKFEHGGGDGLEFGTFNAEHTSLFTDDYRFNKDGKIRLATRFTVDSNKIDPNDPTTNLKYIKNNAENNAAKALENGVTYRQADDFYDFIDDADPSAKWEDVVNVANGVFGEIEDGIKVQYKYTKKGNTKPCDTISVVGFNNHATNDFTVEGVTIAPGQSATIASCSLLDMIKLVNYMKTNNLGPWEPTSEPQPNL